MKFRSLLMSAAAAAFAGGLLSTPALAWPNHRSASNESSSERAETAQLNEQQLNNAGPYEQNGYGPTETRYQQDQYGPQDGGYSGEYRIPTNNGGNGIHSANGEPPANGETTPRGTPTTYGPE